jgi:hypothetical protein
MQTTEIFFRGFTTTDHQHETDIRRILNTNSFNTNNKILIWRNGGTMFTVEFLNKPGSSVPMEIEIHEDQ